MSQVSNSEKYYRTLVTDFNHCLTTDAGLEAAFQRVKEYIFKNFTFQDAERKTQEIINYQAAFSRVSRHKRLGEIGYAEYNQEVNKITLSIQEFVQNLRPEGVEINDKALITNEVMREVWDYENNMVSSLVFHEGFGLLSTLFNEFKTACQNKLIVRVDKFFFNGTRKVIIDDVQLSSLTETELTEVISEPMDWSDAIIVQKKDKNGFVLAEGLVLISQENEEIIVRTKRNFEYIRAQIDLMREVIDWFRKIPYPKSMKAPFYVKVHYSGLDVFYYFEN